MPKTRIYRRFFPHKEGDPKMRQLVATFTAGLEKEATFCHEMLQRESTAWKEGQFSQFRYEIEQDPEPIVAASEKEGIQIDLSKARPTKRPITYNLGWHKEHGECHMLAHHPLYGAIRGVVEDSAAGRRLFVNRLSTIWPNAEVK